MASERLRPTSALNVIFRAGFYSSKAPSSASVLECRAHFKTNDTTFNAELAGLADQIDLSGLCGFCVDRRQLS
jgi:hypothetical protein